MIIDQVKHHVEMSAPGVASTFTIEDNSKVFEALSKNLYKDDVLAVVREVSCNAYDAHVDAGKLNIPFIINVPNTFSPHFEVKDFGKGLTEIEIMGDIPNKISGLYTSYFKSSKNDSNKQIGGWGLGSKSPFAYTEQFNVESRQNGVCKFYNCFKNEERKPSVIKMGEGPTNEPDGLTVKVPVKREDFYKFKLAIDKVFKFWESKPTFTGSTPLFEELDYSIKEKSFGILKDGQGYLSLIVNNVHYQVDVSKLKLPKVFSTGYSYDTLYNRTVIFCGVGDVNVTLSRDDLEYTKKTVDFINKSLNEVETLLIKDFNDKIKDCVSLNEAFKINDTHPYRIESFDYKGVKRTRKPLHEVIGFGFTVNKVEQGTTKSKEEHYLQSDFYFRFPIIKIDDDKNFSKIQKYLEDNNLKKCYTYTDDRLDVLVKDYIGEIILSSSLPPAPKKPRKSFKAKTYRFNGGMYKTTAFSEEEVDIAVDKGLFIFNMDKIKKYTNWDSIRGILNLVTDITGLKIYKFNRNQKNLLEKNGWVHVVDKVEKLISGIKDEDLQHYYQKAIENVEYKNIINSLVKHANKFEGKLKDFLEEYKTVCNKKSTVKSNLEKLYKMFNDVKCYEFKIPYNIENEYPSVTRFQYDNKLVDYILMIDNWRKAGKMW